MDHGTRTRTDDGWDHQSSRSYASDHVQRRLGELHSLHEVRVTFIMIRGRHDPLDPMTHRPDIVSDYLKRPETISVADKVENSLIMADTGFARLLRSCQFWSFQAFKLLEHFAGILRLVIPNMYKLYLYLSIYYYDAN